MLNSDVLLNDPTIHLLLQKFFYLNIRGINYWIPSGEKKNIYIYKKKGTAYHEKDLDSHDSLVLFKPVEIYQILTNSHNEVVQSKRHCKFRSKKTEKRERHL